MVLLSSLSLRTLVVLMMINASNSLYATDIQEDTPPQETPGVDQGYFCTTPQNGALSIMQHCKLASVF